MELYSDIGTCYRDQGILCTEDECGWCDTIRYNAKETKMAERNIDRTKPAATRWEVKFKGPWSYWIVTAYTLLEAVDEAKKIAAENNKSEDDLLGVTYLMY